MVIRYKPGLNHSEFLGMKEHVLGDYVDYYDYAELSVNYEEVRDDFLALQKSYEKLVEKIGDLYREF